MAEWSPYAEEYNPVTVGSIDGTDTEAHDHGIVRALQSTYRPNKRVEGQPSCIVFIARLNHITTEETLKSVFSEYGQIKSLRLVRDIVTGFSKGYAFLEYDKSSEAATARREAHRTVIDDKEILTDVECERTVKGWVPRRMGGGFGGMKESGQLRFGCRDRPFRKPILLENSKAADFAHSSNREKEERRVQQHTRSTEHYSRPRTNKDYSRYHSGSSKNRDRSRDRDRE